MPRAGVAHRLRQRRGDLARRSAPVLRPTPSRSARERFWLIFHLPTSELSRISTPTIAFSIVST
jgi:hypothetical protein